MKPVDVKPSICIGSNKKEIVRKVLNIKLVTILKYQDMKIFLQKAMFQIGQKKCFWLKKLKLLCRGHILLMFFTSEEIVGTFYKKELKKKLKRTWSWKDNNEKRL